jgi:Transposase
VVDGKRRYSYRQLAERSNEVIVAGMSPDSVYLWTLPMFHCNGWCLPWAVTAVAAQQTKGRDLLAGLKRIGIDEISIRKGQRYLTVVIDHDTGRLVWTAADRSRKTTERFPDLLGEERCKQLKLVSCDMASWITGPISERCRTRASATTHFT